MAKRYSWKLLRRRGSCARGSIRTKKLSGGKLLRICCPKGKWAKGAARCRVGTVGYEVGSKAAKSRRK